MKTFTSALLALLIAGCGPRDSSQVLINETFEVPPKKALFSKFRLELGGSFTMTLTAKGGNLESWVEAGDIPPMVIYTADAAYPKAKVYLDGKEDSSTGTLGWGGANVIFFNRSDAPVKVKCKLTVVPTPLK